MTLTPDRRRHKQNRRDESASSAVHAGEGETSYDGSDAPTYRELLRDAGFDLEGHPLADRFDEVAAPPSDDFEFADAEHPLVRDESP
ncbi:MAG: hypothetical protein L0G69_16315, partial [Brevibacterium sp.]|nr:hypothetical protein [Brevibacterium sp.]